MMIEDAFPSPYMEYGPLIITRIGNLRKKITKSARGVATPDKLYVAPEVSQLVGYKTMITKTDDNLYLASENLNFNRGLIRLFNSAFCLRQYNIYPATLF